MRLHDKVAVITGGASGIGKACAIKFVTEGAKVVIADIQDEAGQQVIEHLHQLGGQATYIHTDVSDYQSVEAAIAQTIHQFGQVDILFNNAGIENAQYNVLDMPIEEYHRTVHVNQHGVFYGIKAAGRVMKERGGVIINTASVYATIADRKQFPYHASKAAVVMMTKAAALELAPYNIRVVGIAPGLIETDIVAAWKQNPAIWSVVEKAQMRGRAGQPHEVANLVSFLASDEASFMNGHVFYVDDGAVSFKR